MHHPRFPWVQYDCSKEQTGRQHSSKRPPISEFLRLFMEFFDSNRSASCRSNYLTNNSIKLQGHPRDTFLTSNWPWAARSAQPGPALPILNPTEFFKGPAGSLARTGFPN